MIALGGEALIGTEQLAGAESSAYRASVLTDSQAVVGELRRSLGVGTVAALAQVSETRAVNEWASGRRAIRSLGAESRLRLAYHALKLLTAAVPEDVAVRWFVQPSPSLNYASPREVLAEGDDTNVGHKLMEAARAFLAGAA